jgi:hypothetical protein
MRNKSKVIRFKSGDYVIRCNDKSYIATNKDFYISDGLLHLREGTHTAGNLNRNCISLHMRLYKLVEGEHIVKFKEKTIGKTITPNYTFVQLKYNYTIYENEKEMYDYLDERTGLKGKSKWQRMCMNLMGILPENLISGYVSQMTYK